MRSRLLHLISLGEERWYSRYQQPFAVDLSLSEALSRFPERNSLHAYMHHYFHHFCPEAVQRHREYFRRSKRGFGENAFHALWWLLFKQYKPVHCVEIGVYRGQVISLWALIGRLFEYSPTVVGISPFSATGDEVSTYSAKIDYYNDTLEAFRHFELPPPHLVRGFSTGPEAQAALSSRLWDLIYIDGSHQYEVVLSDYQKSVQQLRPGGLLVMDDASAETSYRPPRFSFAGHPGPSRVAAQYASRELKFIAAVGHLNVFQIPQAGRNDDLRFKESWVQAENA
jgi:hypothetical protein